MRFRIRFAQQVVGLFIILALVSLAVVIFLMGVNQRWFAKNYTYNSQFQSADGLTTGLAIKLRGFEIGKVAKVSLNASNRVDVQVEIYEEYYEKIKPNSVLELASSPIGLGGGMNLLPGKNDLPPMENNAFLPSTDTVLGRNLIAQGLVDKPAGSEQINAIIAQVEPLLVSLRGTADNTNQLLANINQAVEGKGDNEIRGLLGQVNKITAELAITMQGVNTILADTGPRTNVLLDNVNDITGSLAVTAKNLEDPTGLVPKLIDPDGKLFAQINNIMAQVNDLAAFINKSTPTLAGILEDSKIAIKQASDVLEGVKNNPLLRGGITEQKPQASTFKSFRQEDDK